MQKHVIMNKTYLSADELLQDAYRLALEVYHSDFVPDLIVGVWRGGTPVAIAIHELLDHLGCPTDHIAIKTRSYSGIGERERNIDIDGLGYIAERADAFANILLVDDVYDTGLSLDAVINALSTDLGPRCPNIRVATPWFKPGNNQTQRVPDYYLHTTEDWLVFPHELSGLTIDEIAQKPGLSEVIQQIKQATEQ
ncbi:Uncharacterised protein [BD1-7 clade bacterium]|uniref:Phosphoribosyltransferase domain-containing protein n=1 Tax=BD1-7 clade bacterium TaxID=2029982 RepID=A0A5S9PFA7_9GAMM|nr:Uncharacterised protein [BD1-7 clade bacterium]CAA0102700.1 Uncharacterised protein [BD1-7 clade bacterium]